MIVRPATPTDLPALLALVHRAYRGDAARVGWTHEADLLGGQRTDADSLAATLVDRAQRLLVLEVDDVLRGTVTVGIGGGIAHLGMLAVEPHAQATGLGRSLVAAAEQAALEADCESIEMMVIGVRSELIAWYERLGYGRTGEVRPFPATNPRFGEPKRDDLDFVVLSKGL